MNQPMKMMEARYSPVNGIDTDIDRGGNDDAHDLAKLPHSANSPSSSSRNPCQRLIALEATMKIPI